MDVFIAGVFHSSDGLGVGEFDRGQEPWCLSEGHCSVNICIQIGKSCSAYRVKVSIIISIPFLAFLPPTFTHSHAAPGEGMIAKAQEFIGYLKAGGK